MKVTKLGHCCLLIEYKDKRILTDPGSYSTSQNEVKDIDLVLITHEHGDHLHVESLQIVLENSPQAKIITNGSVQKILADKRISAEVLEHGQKTDFESIILEAFGSSHQEIFNELGQVQNTGYFIDSKLFYPGDALTVINREIPVLAAPVAGPFLTFKMAMDYILQLSPKACFPVHDGMLVEGRVGPILRLPPQILEPKGIKFIPLEAGQSAKFD